MKTVNAIKLKEEIIKKTSKEYLLDRESYLKKLAEIRKKYATEAKNRIN
ncbi:MAG: hypothetical protein KBF60_08265 [Ignavibacteriaceae bacterium]|jgi:hypothetical protein|nr:hypothetical protein [Ignavibacteriaceae bacterium]